MLLDGGVKALSKILEAYIVRHCGQPNPPEIERHDLHGCWPDVGA
jgi:hypothetical protein